MNDLILLLFSFDSFWLVLTVYSFISFSMRVNNALQNWKHQKCWKVNNAFLWMPILVHLPEKSEANNAFSLMWAVCFQKYHFSKTVSSKKIIEQKLLSFWNCLKFLSSAYIWNFSQRTCVSLSVSSAFLHLYKYVFCTLSWIEKFTK